MQGLSPTLCRFLLSLSAYESQWFINYLSSRLRAAAFEYRTMPEEYLRRYGRDFRQNLWRDVVRPP